MCDIFTIIVTETAKPISHWFDVMEGESEKFGPTSEQDKGVDMLGQSIPSNVCVWQL